MAGVKLLTTIFVMGYLAALISLYIKQRELLYYPVPDNKTFAEHMSTVNIVGTSEVYIKTADDVTIQTWYRPPTEANGEIILFLSGNSGNISYRSHTLKILAEMGYGFIIPAWRGFGKSEGTPNKEGLLNDARACVSYLNTNGYNMENVIVVGESLGTGIATHMANEHKFKGILLLSPYTSIADRAQELYPIFPIRDLVLDNFDNLSGIKNVTSPVIIIHGALDQIIPKEHGELVFAKAREPKKLIIYPDRDHFNYNKRAIFLEMRNFLLNTSQ
jgi:pimeloyl-ACP methyl ester carboxylesterase